MKPVLCDAAQKHGGSIVDPDRNYQYYQARNLQDYLKVNMQVPLFLEWSNFLTDYFFLANL